MVVVSVGGGLLGRLWALLGEFISLFLSDWGSFLWAELEVSLFWKGSSEVSELILMSGR